ncbi:trigger factor [Thermincola ferriacetica]|uniref:Trigger factor n=1 Tax=Thermincola ferriacetica TaxID=281456 RepID=A0A0L6W215_9FIRM|nr:trigger factor [Thermincola ferriacetica]KNZ69585.1 trigger factor [Thermincola ferriacetica]
MKVNMEKIEKNLVNLEIEVEQEKFAQAMEKAFKKVASKVSIPGFRKGKAPRVLVERKVGKEYLYDEALEYIVPEAYFDAVKETKIEPIDKPNIEVVQIGDEKPLIFKAKVEVKPEVKLGEYKGLEVKKPEVSITDEDIEQELEKLRQRHAQIINVEDGEAQLHDTVVIDFEGFVDGVAFQGGSGKDYSLELGSGTFIPGFEDQLVGAKVGETREIKVTFPENYHAADLAGKDAVFKVEVKAIKRKQLAAIDDELAKDVSEFETLEELKKDISNKLKEAAEQKAEHEMKDLLVAKAVENAEVEIPNIMVEQRIDSMIQSLAQRLSLQGLSLEEYLKFTNSNMEALREQHRPDAENRVKATLVLEAIAKKENIEPTEEDLEEEIKTMAAQYNAEPGLMRTFIENQGNMEALKQSIAINKTVQFLVDHATIK